MRIFDFNRDGKTDLFETAMGFALLDALCEEERSEADCFADSCPDDEDPDDGLTERDEEKLSLLRDELSDLEDELITVEVNEPDDILSEAYARWEQRRDLLEEQIACVEEQIDDLEW